MNVCESRQKLKKQAVEALVVPRRKYDCLQTEIECDIAGKRLISKLSRQAQYSLTLCETVPAGGQRAFSLKALKRTEFAAYWGT